MSSRFVKAGAGYRWLVDEKPFLALSGEVHNSSASSALFMEPVWDKVEQLGLNTLILPVYWELSEPTPGEYDFSLVENWLREAEKRDLRLILLWFGTWKNSHSTYVPAWIKADLIRYPRAVFPDGTPSKTISPFAEACMEADGRGFGALMGYLKKQDRQGRVIAVQVENESGLLGADRDYAEVAERHFRGAVPRELPEFLDSHPDYLSPTLKKAYQPTGETWRDMFGDQAEEVFMAWYTARYIDTVAAAGKQQNSGIPLFVNAWTEQCPDEPAGLHPSGGPMAGMYAIWRGAAPNLDAIAPDLYLETFSEDFSRYGALPENPFLLPETRNDRWAPGLAFYAFGEHNALCFSPFAVEEMGESAPLPTGTVVQGVFQTMVGSGDPILFRESYALLDSLTPLLTQHAGTGRVRGFIQSKLFHQSLILPDLTAVIHFPQFVDHTAIPAGGIVMDLGEDTYLLAGFGYSVSFYGKGEKARRWEVLSIEEGKMGENGFCPVRRLNGDELHLSLPAHPTLYRVKLYPMETNPKGNFSQMI